MINSFDTDTEKELGRFYISSFKKESQEHTLVRIVDMGGWTLLECFTESTDQLCFFSFDKADSKLEWIQMGDDETAFPFEKLKTALLRLQLFHLLQD